MRTLTTVAQISSTSRAQAQTPSACPPRSSIREVPCPSCPGPANSAHRSRQLGPAVPKRRGPHATHGWHTDGAPGSCKVSHGLWCGWVAGLAMPCEMEAPTGAAARAQSSRYRYVTQQISPVLQAQWPLIMAACELTPRI